jgi:hypothetical protein
MLGHSKNIIIRQFKLNKFYKSFLISYGGEVRSDYKILILK